MTHKKKIITVCACCIIAIVLISAVCWMWIRSTGPGSQVEITIPDGWKRTEAKRDPDDSKYEIIDICTIEKKIQVTGVGLERLSAYFQTTPIITCYMIRNNNADTIKACAGKGLGFLLRGDHTIVRTHYSHTDNMEAVDLRTRTIKSDSLVICRFIKKIGQKEVYFISFIDYGRLYEENKSDIDRIIESFTFKH